MKDASLYAKLDVLKKNGATVSTICNDTTRRILVCRVVFKDKTHIAIYTLTPNGDGVELEEWLEAKEVMTL